MDTYYSAPKTEFNDWFEIKATENMIPEDEEVEVQTDLGMYPILYHPYLHMIIDHFVYTYIFICTLIYHRVSASGDYIFQ